MSGPKQDASEMCSIGAGDKIGGLEQASFDSSDTSMASFTLV